MSNPSHTSSKRKYFLVHDVPAQTGGQGPFLVSPSYYPFKVISSVPNIIYGAPIFKTNSLVNIHIHAPNKSNSKTISFTVPRHLTHKTINDIYREVAKEHRGKDKSFKKNQIEFSIDAGDFSTRINTTFKVLKQVLTLLRDRYKNAYRRPSLSHPFDLSRYGYNRRHGYGSSKPIDSYSKDELSTALSKINNALSAFDDDDDTGNYRAISPSS